MIEAKGKDSGGYPSAQMSFSMTAGYAKVLRTFQGSLAFERLGIAFYVVERIGEVHEIEPRLISAWIDSLSRRSRESVSAQERYPGPADPGQTRRSRPWPAVALIARRP